MRPRPSGRRGSLPEYETLPGVRDFDNSGVSATLLNSRQATVQVVS
jgi:hypothetical protein